jgi:serine protease Do
MVMASIAVVLLGGMTVLELRRREKTAAAAVTAASVVAVPAPATPAGAPPASIAKPAAENLTTEQIAKRALPSVVGLQCGEVRGAGFFVSEDLVVTNAHVTCAGKQMVSVRLNDGREVLGVVKTRDPWIDVATIEVAASNVAPLPTGDPLALAAGARVVAVGSPKGLDFSVSDGTASFVGRNLFGVGYVQFSAPINPGNSGGPLLDSTGAVVGIVTLKRTDADGIAFALPIWYARPPADPALLARWNDFLAKTQEADAAERQRLVARLVRPALVDLKMGRDGLNALFAQSRSERPQPGRMELQIEQGPEQCQVRGSVERWVALDDVAKDGADMPRRLEWLVHTGEAKSFYFGLAPLDLSACRLSDRVAQVRFEGGEPISVPGEALLAARNVSRGTEAKQNALAAIDDAVKDLKAEQWRSAFRNANSRLNAARALLAEARSRAESAGGEGERAGWQARAIEAEVFVHDAEQQLADLDRRASNAAVPREWRH